MRRPCWIVIGFATYCVAMVVATTALSAEIAGADSNSIKPDRVELDFFEKKIRPVLVERF